MTSSANFSGLTSRAITKTFLSDHDWPAEISKNNGFAEFRDGDLIYAVMDEAKIVMKIIHRTAAELFEVTARRFVKTEGRCLATTGLFADNSSQKIQDLGTFGLAIPGQALAPDLQDYMGFFVVSPGDRRGESRPGRAHLGFSNSAAARGRFVIGVGDPSSAFDAALGGLAALSLPGGNEIPSGDPKLKEMDDFYQSNSGRGADVGRTVVALSGLQGFPRLNREFSLVVALILPDEKSMPLNTIRDRLLDAGFDSAVLLDGSDSVLWNLDGTIRATQGFVKNKLTSVAIGFTLPK